MLVVWTIISLIVFLVLCPRSVPAQSSSARYRLAQSTLNGGGSVSASPSGTSYRLAASFGQESTIGTSSSFRYVLQSGFWSFQGSGLVPVILYVTKNGSAPANPDLSWTGNNPPYALYSTAGCSNVTSGFVTTTPLQAWTDTAPPLGVLDCYSVFATAPGPIALIGGISPSMGGTIEARP